MKISAVDRRQTINSQNKLVSRNSNKKSHNRTQNSLNDNILVSQNVKNKKNSTSFKGGADVAFNVLDKFFTLLDKNAMIQVAFVDSVATDIPRTLVDLGTGLAAALETMRREFSGLIVNCLIPGVIVKGVSKALPKNDIIKGTNVSSSWANGDSISKLSGIFKSVEKSGVEDKTRAFVEKTLSSLEGLDGKNWVKYADSVNSEGFQEAVSLVTEAIGKEPKTRKTLLSQAQSKISGLTKAESILRFVDETGKIVPHSNLEETLRDVVDLGSKFNGVKQRTLQSVQDMPASEITDKVVGAIDDYSKSLTKHVNKKSLIGLGIVIAMAISVQKINRAITRKQFKAEGAPIYKDFGKKETKQKMDENQKKAFGAKKMMSALGMYGLALLSMMKKPNLGMFQFSGIFPTLDQCRWIASSTFASRMLAAEDENELRESTVRDIASFAGLYFLGDYVKKGVASGIEALSKTNAGAKLVGENVVLLNRKKVVEKGSSAIAYRLKQFGNWIKNTDLKSAAEVSSTNVRNLRNICRVADIAFSIVMLGILLPRYNRSVTEKKVAAAKKLEEMQKSQMFNPALKAENTPNIFKDLI